MNIVQAIIAFITAILGLIIGFNPPTTKRSKWKCSIGFVILGIASIVVTCVQVHDEKKDAEKIENLSTNLATLKDDVYASNIEIITNQVKLSATYALLTSHLASNATGLDASTRSNIILANRQFEVIRSDIVDLHAWSSDLQERRALAEIGRAEQQKEDQKAEKLITDVWFPIYDYAIRKLERTLSDMPNSQSEKLLSDYRGMPDAMPTNRNVISEISFGTNATWNFKIHLIRLYTGQKLSSSFGPRLEIVTGTKATLKIDPAFGGSRMKVTVNSPNEDVPPIEVSIGAHTNTLNQAIRDLFTLTNRK